METVMGGLGMLAGLGEAIIITIMLRQRNILNSSAVLTWQQISWLAAITGIAFVVAYRQVGWNFLLIQSLAFTCFLVVIAAIDLWYGLIMQPIIMAMLSVGAIFMIIYRGALSLNISGSIIGCIIGGGSLFLLAWGSGKMGYGDAWFAAALGLWLGWQALLILLWLAFLGGGIIGLGLLIIGIKQRQDTIPFGPFLATAAFFVYFYYGNIVSLLGWLLL